VERGKYLRAEDEHGDGIKKVGAVKKR